MHVASFESHTRTSAGKSAISINPPTPCPTSPPSMKSVSGASPEWSGIGRSQCTVYKQLQLLPVTVSFLVQSDVLEQVSIPF